MRSDRDKNPSEEMNLYKGKSPEEMTEIIIEFNKDLVKLENEVMGAQSERSIARRNGQWSESQEDEYNEMLKYREDFYKRHDIARKARTKIEESTRSNKQKAIKTKLSETKDIKEKKQEARRSSPLSMFQKHEKENKNKKEEKENAGQNHGNTKK